MVAMLNEFLRLLSRAYTSISVDLLAYVIVPASLFLTASALHPEELEDRISFLSKKKISICHSLVNVTVKLGWKLEI
ncbi:hypothetical protein [uncultured Methylobacterium sp.]|uniref:hypothetical protein n=1 Tax=uncultured Methylobacterium sp. TaxID=157278 RepID=UPI00261E3CDC|nr:hypothetical protein [uncultured Methylobacterium sp.]